MRNEQSIITLNLNNQSMMFMPKTKETPMAKETQTPELSLFDVKELYDLAYEIKAEEGENERHKAVLAEAVKLDMAYRRQLASKNTYTSARPQQVKTAKAA